MQTYSIKWFSLGFWLIQLPWMFISSYTAIYFFLKSIFSNICISVNTILKCSYLFLGWETVHPLSTYATGEIEGFGGHPNCVEMRTGGQQWKMGHKIRTYVLSWLPQTNVAEYFLCIGLAKYIRASPPSRKM